MISRPKSILDSAEALPFMSVALVISADQVPLRETLSHLCRMFIAFVELSTVVKFGFPKQRWVVFVWSAVPLTLIRDLT
jgi:hypothetical protein